MRMTSTNLYSSKKSFKYLSRCYPVHVESLTDHDALCLRCFAIKDISNQPHVSAAFDLEEKKVKVKSLLRRISVLFRIKIWPSVEFAQLVRHHASVSAVLLEVNFIPLWPVPAILGCLIPIFTHLIESHCNPDVVKHWTCELLSVGISAV